MGSLRVNASVAGSLDAVPSAIDGRAMSFLVVGSDGRTSLARRYRKGVSPGSGERADSILLVIADARQRRVEVVAVPRDLGVQLPGVGYQRLGWALDYGGASLMVEATRRALDVPIHHYVGFDFHGFVGVVNALGGIEVTLDTPVHDHRTGLGLRRGRQRIHGRAALAFVRSRHQESKRGGPRSAVAIGDTARRDRLRIVGEAMSVRARRGVGMWAAIRLASAATAHICVDGSFADLDANDLLARARGSDVTFTDLPVRWSRQLSELRSPFPPHQMSGARYVELDVADAEPILRRMRAALEGGIMMADESEASYPYDVFVSYRQQDPDCTWVRSVLVPALDAAGLDVFLDERSFTPGLSVIENMSRAVDESRYTVAVMSPAYFGSDFTKLERIMAQHLGLEQGRRRLIGLMLAPCDPPTELRPFLWLDVSNVRDGNAPEIQRLIETLRG
jgi:LCP family protein required for cell wall assembly